MLAEESKPATDTETGAEILVDRKLQEQVSQSLRTIPEQAVIKMKLWR